MYYVGMYITVSSPIKNSIPINSPLRTKLCDFFLPDINFILFHTYYDFKIFGKRLDFRLRKLPNKKPKLAVAGDSFYFIHKKFMNKQI